MCKNGIPSAIYNLLNMSSLVPGLVATMEHHYYLTAYDITQSALSAI